MAKLIEALKRHYYLHSDRYFMRVIRVLYLLVGDVGYLITFLVPKNQHLWVFGAWDGANYSDNSKYLFEHVCKTHPELRAVWLTRDKATCHFIRGRGFEAHPIRSVRGVLLRIRSSAIVLSGGLLDVNAFAVSVLPARAKLVQLWHGTPLKKLLFDDPNLSSTITVLFPNFRVLPFRKRTLSDELYVAASQEVKNKFMTAFRVPADRVAVTGYPRTDSLFGLSTERPPLLDKLADLKNKRFVIGLYAPTHRLLGKQSMQLLIDDLERIEPQLAELRVVLLVKLHFWHLDELNSLNAQLDHVLFVHDEEIYQDIYPILPETDFLITDYSSIYFDYLLLNKPIIFAPFDIASYTEIDHQLYYHYEDVTPGPKARNWHEVAECIEDILTKSDLYEEERRRVSCVFNAYADGCSSQRVYEAIVTKLLDDKCQ
jgi:CDP-glycerol glycerophosphotransferase (TagB/SpsB family)